jgi:hypothetical protein
MELCSSEDVDIKHDHSLLHLYYLDLVGTRYVRNTLYSRYQLLGKWRTHWAHLHSTVVIQCFSAAVVMFLYGAGVEPSPLLLWPFINLWYQSRMINGDDCGAISGMNEWHGDTEVLGANLPQCLSVHTYSTWRVLASNPGRRCGKRRLTAWVTARHSAAVNETFRFFAGEMLLKFVYY